MCSMHLGKSAFAGGTQLYYGDYTVLLGVVKRHLGYFKDQGYLSDAVEEKLRKIPWIAGS